MLTRSNSIICKKEISPFYVYMKMMMMTDYLKQLGAVGSTIPNVNKTLFGQIPIMLHDSNTLNLFHDKVSPLFSTIRENQLEIIQLEKLKKISLSTISSR